jgi:type III restriction enzyme
MATSIIAWIIETKGRVWEGTEAKDEAIEDWCKRVSKQTGQVWRFARVNQGDFDSQKPKTLGDAVKSLS